MAEFNIIIHSGSVKTTEKILDATKEAVFKTIAKAASRAKGDMLQTVAKETGRLRAGFRGGVLSFTASGLGSNKTKITLKRQDLIKFIAQSPRYSKYHIREHPDFNPNFAGGYKNPTTSGTEPISTSKYMQLFSSYLRSEISGELQGKGLKSGSSLNSFAALLAAILAGAFVKRTIGGK